MWSLAWSLNSVDLAKASITICFTKSSNGSKTCPIISIVCTSEIDDTSLHGSFMLQLPRWVSCSSSTMILSCKLPLTYTSETTCLSFVSMTDDGSSYIALKSIPLFKACWSPRIACASAYLSNLASSSSRSQILRKSCSFSCFSSAFYLFKAFHSEMLTNIWAVDTIIIYC